MKSPSRMRGRQQGISLIEVLVAMLITVIGSLGMIALQVRAQQAQLDAHQRSQALLLAEDMINRLESNPAAAAERTCYVTETGSGYGVSFYGTGNTNALNCGSGGAANAQAQADVQAWDGLLKGQTETLNGGNVGGLLDARGCITTDEIVVVGATTETLFTVTVAWQGQADLAPPLVTCAAGLYNSDGADTRRRAVSLQMHFGAND